ncbi:hypothetical protein KCP73_19370 [Salmonella enterica subsp. enterica]|nr:hypothetical protein KCP73_19370 [Salmonella enterica subsp. enterica]
MTSNPAHWITVTNEMVLRRNKNFRPESTVLMKFVYSSQGEHRFIAQIQLQRLAQTSGIAVMKSTFRHEALKLLSSANVTHPIKAADRPTGPGSRRNLPRQVSPSAIPT